MTDRIQELAERVADDYVYETNPVSKADLRYLLGRVAAAEATLASLERIVGSTARATGASLDAYRAWGKS